MQRVTIPWARVYCQKSARAPPLAWTPESLKVTYFELIHNNIVVFCWMKTLKFSPRCQIWKRKMNLWSVYERKIIVSKYFLWNMSLIVLWQILAPEQCNGILLGCLLRRQGDRHDLIQGTEDKCPQNLRLNLLRLTSWKSQTLNTCVFDIFSMPRI